MRVAVKLIGLAPPREPAAAEAGWYSLSVPETATAGLLPGLFGLDDETVIAVRDKRPCPPDAPLEAGDRILLLTMAEGG